MVKGNVIELEACVLNLLVSVLFLKIRSKKAS